MKIRTIEEKGVGKFTIAFKDGVPFVKRMNLARAIYNIENTGFIANQFNDSVCESFTIANPGGGTPPIFVNAFDVVKVLDEIIYRGYSKKRETKIMLRDFLKNKVLPYAKNPETPALPLPHNGYIYESPKQNHFKIRVYFHYRDLYVAAADITRIARQSKNGAVGITEWHRKLTCIKIPTPKGYCQAGFYYVIKATELIEELRESRTGTPETRKVAVAILERLLKEYEGRITMENNQHLTFEQREQLALKQKAEGVTTLTTADIEDIKERADAIKQAFDVSKSDALIAVIALKEEEIGRPLPSLRDLLKAK